jgi:beta-galactosidase/beta-glucuronidase
MEELEGRLSDAAHVALVEAAVGARFNMLRVWGGGMFLPEAFYNACDALGVLVYHDMQYAQ